MIVLDARLVLMFVQKSVFQWFLIAWDLIILLWI